MKATIARAFGLEGTVLEDVRLAGRIVDVVVEINQAELTRRRNVDRGVKVDADALHLLAGLPYREPVALSEFDPFTRALIQTLGEPLARIRGSYVERIWTPPLDIRGFLVVSANWRAALRRVSLFTADAPRAIAYTGSGRLTQAECRAEELGVGLARMSDGMIEVLVEPERHLLRHDEIRWSLAETLFSVWSGRTVRA
jgi:hypothetical protein